MATLSQHYPSSAAPVKDAAALKGKGKAAAVAAPPADADEQAHAALTAFDLDSVRRRRRGGPARRGLGRRVMHGCARAGGADAAVTAAQRWGPCTGITRLQRCAPSLPAAAARKPQAACPVAGAQFGTSRTARRTALRAGAAMWRQRVTTRAAPSRRRCFGVSARPAVDASATPAAAQV